MEILLFGYLAVAGLFATMGLLEAKSGGEARVPLVLLAAFCWPIAILAVVVAQALARHPNEPAATAAERTQDISCPASHR
jgi:hypothetical protein